MPIVDITLIEGVPARLSDLLLQGELDLAVMAQPESFSERFAAACGPRGRGAAARIARDRSFCTVREQRAWAAGRLSGRLPFRLGIPLAPRLLNPKSLGAERLGYLTR